MVAKITHSQLNELVKELYKKQISLFIYGTFGIGKSYTIRDTAKEIAKNKNLIFVEFMKLTAQEKEKVFKQPEKYFILLDIRLSEYDITDIKGFPKMDDKDYLSWKLDLWALLTQHKKSKGILFLDELNLARQLVLSTSYKIINDRIIGDSKINDNWGIIGAGNLITDKAFTFEIPLPLRDRFCECELINSDIEDFNKYMIKNKFRKEIIGFLNTHPSYIRVINEDDKIKNTTPRGWERLNILIKDLTDYKSDKFKILCSTSISETISSDFIAYCKIQDKINIMDYIKNPKKIKSLNSEEDSLSIKYFITTTTAELYTNDKINFDKIMEISQNFDEIKNPELVVLLWTMLLEYSKDKMTKDFTNYGNKKNHNFNLITKYSSYIT